MGRKELDARGVELEAYVSPYAEPLPVIVLLGGVADATTGVVNGGHPFSPGDSLLHMERHMLRAPHLAHPAPCVPPFVPLPVNPCICLQLGEVF